MLIFPDLWPDETLYSLMARISRINGISDLEVTRILLGQDHPMSVINCLSNIKHFSVITNGVYGSPREIPTVISIEIATRLYRLTRRGYPICMIWRTLNLFPC